MLVKVPDADMNPVFSTVDIIYGSVPTSRKRQTCAYSSSELSPTSPVRVYPAVAYYSAHPPSTPLYLIPISATYNNTPNQYNDSQQIPKMKLMQKDSEKIVKKVLRSIINSATLTLTTNEFARNHFETPLTKKSCDRKPCDFATQTRALNLTNRYCSSENEDNSSSIGLREGPGASERSWAGEVRALRDSHVRLVLRQLRQLRDIDRLDRALRRPPPNSPVPRSLDSLT